MDEKEKQCRDKKALRLYVIIALGVSYLLEIAYIIWAAVTKSPTSSSFSGNGFFMVAIMWVPAITAIVFSLKYYKKISILGVSIGRAVPILLGLFLPVIYLGLSYFISWAITGDETIGFEALALQLGWEDGKGDIPVLFVLSHVFVGIIPACAGAFGQELGWRGFMYPVMERVHGRNKAVIFSGLIFALWNLPLVLSGLYQISTPLWYGAVMFVIYETILGIILAWLRSVSKSIIPPLLIIASGNLFGQLVFDQLGTKKAVPYLAGETGIITIVLMAAVAALGMIFWKKHDKKIEAAQ